MARGDKARNDLDKELISMIDGLESPRFFSRFYLEQT